MYVARHAVTRLSEVAVLGCILCLAMAIGGRNVVGLRGAVFDLQPAIKKFEKCRWVDESLQEKQGVRILEADAVVHAIGRRLTESAARCANLSRGAISQAPMKLLWRAELLPAECNDNLCCCPFGKEEE